MQWISHLKSRSLPSLWMEKKRKKCSDVVFFQFTTLFHFILNMLILLDILRMFIQILKFWFAYHAKSKKNIRKNSSKDNWKIIFDDFSYFFLLFFNFFYHFFVLRKKQSVIEFTVAGSGDLTISNIFFFTFFFFFFFKNCCTFRIADDLRQLVIMNRIRKEEKVQRKWKKILEIFQAFLCHLSNQFISIRYKSVFCFDLIEFYLHIFFFHINDITHPKFPSGIPPIDDPYRFDGRKKLIWSVWFRY